MTVFANYARYYDLLYKDKNYAEECAFVLEVLNRQGCTPASLLDLGCGTGRHALEMAKKGITVEGADLSETMLDMGNAALDKIDGSTLPAPKPVLHQGDARTLRLGKTFAAVTSLFHVMSYQTTEEDALALLATAKTHLEPGGLFLFDFWHGPGVLSDLPTEREKTLQDRDIIVQRRAVPVLRYADNVVEVHYTITFSGPQGGKNKEIKEVHHLRYWFLPELRYLARTAGFETVSACAWEAFATPGPAHWYAYMLLRKPAMI
jgi:SAM-dependent methyltransferase